MRFGNAAWGLRETPLEKQLAITEAMGIGLLELQIGNYPKDFLQINASDAQIAEVKAMFARHHVKLECGATGNDFTVDDTATQLENVKKAIVIAEKLGMKYLRVFAGFTSDSLVYGKRFQIMLDCLKATADFAGAHHVIPVVETHGGVTANGNALIHFNSTSTRIDCWKEMVKTGVMINFDPANLAAVGSVDPAEFYDLFKPYVKYVHLKDFRDVEGGIVPAACGEGRLDWPKLMKTLASCDAPALIEYELPGDVEDGLRRSLAFLKKF